jgi:hypothetical protein
VQFGAASEVIVTVVGCLANAYRNGTLSTLRFEDTPVIFASVAFVIGGLVYTTLFQEKLLDDFRKHRIAVVIAVLIVAAIEVGYFFQPICQCKKPTSTGVVSRAVPLQS